MGDDDAPDTRKLRQAARRQQAYLCKKTTSELREALRRNALILYLEPILYTQTMKLGGARAVLKIQRQGFGAAPAQHILKLVENTSILVDVGCWMVAQILHRTKKFPKNFVFTVPVSAYQLQNAKFVSYTVKTLGSLKIRPGRLQLALNEADAQADTHELDTAMQILAEAGVTFSVNHTKTADTALALLEKERYSTLSLDKYMVATAQRNTQKFLELQALSKKFNDYNCKLSIRGVESIEMINLYGAIGIDELQGAAIAPSMPLTTLQSHPLLVHRLETTAQTGD